MEDSQTLVAHGVSHDMTQPLTSYFISASHNTYLDAGQLWGTSSVDAIARALSLGSRVIELDTYDGKTEPEVKHSIAPTGKITFRNAVRTIASVAFGSDNINPS